MSVRHGLIDITEQICEGHYEVATSSLDLRAGSINNTAIKCGAVFGAPADGTVESLSTSTFTGVQMARKNLYVCATAYKASIKTVHFRHNGTSEDFAGLEVIDIVAKTYSAEISKPLWAVENSGDRRMGFDPLWGITSDAFEDTEGFDTLRSESLWLPTSPSMTDGIGQTEGGDALAAAGGFLLRLANLYQPWIDAPDFSGAMEFALQERWSRLSQNHTTVSSIPSLILTNGLAAGLVGTKTSFSSRYVEWPASLAVENSTRGLPRAKVQFYRRIIQYDIRYAIPSFLILALVLASVVAAVWSAITSSSIVCTMQRLYNQTSAGRLAVTLLQPDQSDPTQSSHAWVAKEGSLRIAFGMISQSEDDNFCRIVQNGESGSEMPPETVTEAAKTERGHLLPGTAQ